MKNLVNDEIYVLVYGTLREAIRHPMHHQLARHARRIGEGTFRGKLYNLGRFPGAVKSRAESDRVRGEFYRVHEAEKLFELLDDYEGEQFKRAQVPARLDAGGKITAWVYLYDGRVDEDNRIRSGDYLEFLANR